MSDVQPAEPAFAARDLRVLAPAPHPPEELVDTDPLPDGQTAQRVLDDCAATFHRRQHIRYSLPLDRIDPAELQLEDGQRRWALTNAPRAWFEFGVVAAGGSAFCADSNGTLFAVDIASGEVAWEVELGKPPRQRDFCVDGKAI